MSMATKTIRVIFPKKLFQDPVIFDVAKHSGVIPAITSARIDEKSAEFVLKLQGNDEEIKCAIDLFAKKGTVSPIDDAD